MSILRARLNRLYKSSCSLVSQNDFELLAAKWKAILDEEETVPEDFEEAQSNVAIAVANFPINKNRNGRDVAIIQLRRQYPIAYAAYVYQLLTAVAKGYPDGIWIPKTHLEFWNTVRTAREQGSRR